MFRFIAVFLLVVFLSACMSAPDAQQSAPVLGFTTSHSIAVTVVDNRPYVLNGDKERYFAGLNRDPYGVPWSMPTYQKQPMSDLLQDRILASFKNQGVKASALKSPSDATVKDIPALITGNSADRKLVIILNEWKKESHPESYVLGFSYVVDFFYDVDVKVFDTQGNLLATEDFKATETDPQEGMNTFVQDHKKYKDKLEILINNPKIQAAL